MPAPRNTSQQHTPHTAPHTTPHTIPHTARLTILGSGAAITSTTRDNTSLLLELDDLPLLIDFPGCIARKLLAADCDPLTVRHAFITHHHVDHIHGLPAFIQETYVRLRFHETDRTGPGRDYALHLLGPPDTIRTATELLALLGYGPADKPDLFPIHTTPLDPPEHNLTLPNNWRLRCIAGEHSGMTVLGCIAISPDDRIRIAYSSDSRPTRRFLEAAAGADVLIHDIQHATNAPPGHGDADTLLATLHDLTPPRRIIPVHISSLHSDEAPAIHARLTQALPDTEIIIPTDGQCAFEAGG